MRGTISFLAIEPNRLEQTLLPLLAGGRIRPEPYLDAAAQLRMAEATATLFKSDLCHLIDEALPPPPPEEGPLWRKVKARLERLDHRASALGALAAGVVEPELHLSGRPFLITEGSAENVAERVEAYLAAATPREVADLALEQLVHLHPELGRAIRPDVPPAPSDLAYRSELLGRLRALHERVQAARQRSGTEARGALETLVAEVPWRAAEVLRAVTPSWIARDVDGLVTVCHAAAVGPPPELEPAQGLLAGLCDEFPALGLSLHAEIEHERDVGAWVAPGHVAGLLDFLGSRGAEIIRAAARHGEGPECTTLLRKVRECLTYAARRGAGYLEVAGLPET